VVAETPRVVSLGKKGDGKVIFLPKEDGGLVEYGLVLVLVAIVVIAVVLLLKPGLTNITVGDILSR